MRILDEGVWPCVCEMDDYLNGVEDANDKGREVSHKVKIQSILNINNYGEQPKVRKKRSERPTSTMTTIGRGCWEEGWSWSNGAMEQ